MLVNEQEKDDEKVFFGIGSEGTVLYDRNEYCDAERDKADLFEFMKQCLPELFS